MNTGAKFQISQQKLHNNTFYKYFINFFPKKKHFKNQQIDFQSALSTKYQLKNLFCNDIYDFVWYNNNFYDILTFCVAFYSLCF